MWIPALLTGIFFWTLAEYLLHRFLGHVHKGKNFFKKEHYQHHSEYNYFAPAWKKALAAVVVGGCMTGFIGWVLTLEIAISFTAGFIGMYLLYEITHYRYHAHQPIPFFIPLRKHHFYHHFHHPGTNFGVTTRFWDRVFGTYVPVDEEVSIPATMAPQWLLDENTRQIKPGFRHHFRLRGKKNR